MSNPIALKNDIKHHLDKINPDFYHEIPEGEIYIVHNIFFNPSETNSNGYSALTCYYNGVASEIAKIYDTMIFWYEQSATRNFIKAMVRLEIYHKGRKDIVQEYVYRLMRLQQQYCWYSLRDNWACIKNDFGMSVIRNEDRIKVYEILGNYYKEQHNYDLMEQYFKTAKRVQDYIDMEKFMAIVNTSKNINISNYELSKKYANGQQLEELKKHYGITEEGIINSQTLYPCTCSGNTCVGLRALTHDNCNGTVPIISSQGY